MAKEDFYSILGVGKSATTEEIRKAYTEKAKIYHPDKYQNQNEKDKATKQFQGISEAYNVLKDPKAKANYDRFGDASGASGGPEGFGGFGNTYSYEFSSGDKGGSSDFFSDLFEQFFQKPGGKKQQESQKGEDIMCSMDISLEDAFLGKEVKFEIDRQENCTLCNGSGYTGQPEKCKTCDGSGIAVSNQSFGFFQQACGPCNGSGLRKKGISCKNCYSYGQKKVSAKIVVNIPKGVNTGEKIQLPGEGHAGKNNGKSGNIVIEINVKNHETFKRKDKANLMCFISVPLKTALLGGEVPIKTINGDMKNLKIPSCSQNNQEIVLIEGGMIVEKYNVKNRGDLYVTIKIKNPTSLTPEQRKALGCLPS
jgi:molecular chaperone DnaJ